MGKKKVWRTTWWKWKMERDHLSSILYIGGGAGSKEKKDRNGRQEEKSESRKVGKKRQYRKCIVPLLCTKSFDLLT